VQVGKIYFSALVADPVGTARRATTNIQAIDLIGSPMIAELHGCDSHTEQLMARGHRSLDVAALNLRSDSDGN
jgi:hypothetical protein